MIKDLSPTAHTYICDASGRISRRSFLLSGSLLLAMQTAKLYAGDDVAQPLTDPQSPLCFATSKTLYPPLLERFIGKLDPTADDFLIERYAAGIQPVLDMWSSSLCDSVKNTEAIRLHVAESLRASSLVPSEVVALRKEPPLRIERRIYRGEAIDDAEKFLAEWTTYLASFATIESFELQIFGIRVTSRVGDTEVDTDIRFNLVGIAHDGSREQRTGIWHLSWAKIAKAQGPQWMVGKWTAESELRSRLTGQGFTEITSRCLAAGAPGMAQLLPGIDHWRTALDGASGIDVYGNHGVAVGDIDGSGYDSFYICQPSGLPNRLYRNRGDGTFEDITEASGAGILDGTASALFADFQNRGKQDLLVVRTGGPLLFSNMGGGRFEPRPDAFHFARTPQGTFTSAAVADYNRDGLLDIYFCVYNYYKGLNHHQYPSPYYDAQNGPPNYLFRNRGDGSFEDVTQASGMDRNNNRFSFAAAWCDYDNNGLPDLYVANDFGRKNLYRSNGDGTFTDVAAKAGVEDYGPGMSTCWVDIDNDGLQDVYVANMWLAEGQRITADDHFLAGVDPAVRSLYRKHNAGNSLYRNTSTGSFEDKSVAAGTSICGWSWSCASWDFDNDGWPDIYVANGFVSGPNRYDLQSFFWRQVAQRSMGDSAEYEMAWNAINELVRSDYSWSGYQRNVFFASNRDGSFSEVSGALGLDIIDDSRAYALSDFDHDGRLEFVLKNRTGPQVRIFRNDLEGIGNSIAFRLIGHASNRDAIGAVVTIESGTARQIKFVSAGSGFASQHTKELFFGLGAESKNISVSVKWPTGEVAHYDNLPPNHRVQIEEGKSNFEAKPYRPRPTHAEPTRPAASTLAPRTPATTETISTWLVAPLMGPDLRAVDLSGEVHVLSALKGGPVLLTFLRADCGETRLQLGLLEKAADDFALSGLALFVVSANSANTRQALDLIQSNHSNLPIYPVGERDVEAWNIQYRYLFDRRRDMPIPMSFLLDSNGAVVRVYHGVVTPKSVLADAKSTAATQEERLTRAMPFPGLYYGPPMKHDYLSFGIAFSEYGYVDEAQNAFQRATEDDPGNEVAWFNLGTIYLGKNMYPEARKCLSEAIRLNPQDSDAWNNLGSVSGREEKYDEAVTEFRRAAEANPNHWNAVQNMMQIYQYQGRIAEGQKAIEGLIARAPGNADLHLGLAIAMMAQNNLQGARLELEMSIRLRPNNPDAINNLGALLLRMGLTQEALERFEECRRLAPDFNRAALNTAVVYNRAGQRDQARQVLQEFLARHPGDEEVRAALNKMGLE
jgi:tetratricopeptide (TPR) repeat protein